MDDQIYEYIYVHIIDQISVTSNMTKFEQWNRLDQIEQIGTPIWSSMTILGDIVTKFGQIWSYD